MDTLKDGEAKALNDSSPADQLVQVGSRIKDLEDKSLYFFEKAITADGTGGLDIFDVAGAPFALEVINVIAQARATSGSGTVKLTDGTNDISDAIAMATDKTSIKAGTIDDVYSTLAKGDSLQVVSNGANDRGLVTVVAVRR